MELYIAGGCSEHGRNCFLVKGEKISFLVDAGLMKERPEIPYPELRDEDIRQADYLFLTHCHADHTGAISWLKEKGFSGEMIGARETFEWISDSSKERTLESLGLPGKKCKVNKHLTLMWGRSGHCIGSVWYLFKAEGKRILFTGDYTEHSYAYHCDKIRDRKADVAIIDCAYGRDQDDGPANRKILEEELNRLIALKKPLVFPVPSHGRGLDLIRLLSNRHVKVYVPDSLIHESLESGDPKFWLKRKYRSALDELHLHSLDELEQEILEGAREFCFKDRQKAVAVLVKDSQLYRPEYQEIADAAVKAGGRVVLTGKQVPDSYARELLDRGEAEFYRISVHQNIKEMKRLASKNRFRYVIPYHCRQNLSFREPYIIAVRAGDHILF